MTPTVIDFSVLDKIPSDNNPVAGEKRPRRAFRGMDKKMAEVKTAEETAREQALASAQNAADAANGTREGKGTRLSVSSTRGKNPVPVTYEAFDTDKAETLPDSVAEFVSLSGIDDEAMLVSFLITGYNDNSFRVASDPVAEFVNPVWPSEVALSFKNSVKQLVKAGVFASIDDAVAIIKPQVDAKFAATA